MRQITCPHCADTYPDFDVAHVCSKGPYAPKIKPKMNERIRELADEAGLRFTQLMSNPMVPVVDGRETDLAKFAELIVRECARVIDRGDGKLSTIAETAWCNGCRDDILKHFGVEE